MDQSKFLKSVIIVLLLINIGTLAFMWKKMSGHDKHMQPGEIGRYLAHELHFKKEQVIQFEQLHDEHRNNIDNLRRNSKDLHDKFFELFQHWLSS